VPPKKGFEKLLWLGLKLSHKIGMIHG